MGPTGIAPTEPDCIMEVVVIFVIVMVVFVVIIIVGVCRPALDVLKGAKRGAVIVIVGVIVVVIVGVMVVVIVGDNDVGLCDNSFDVLIDVKRIPSIVVVVIGGIVRGWLSTRRSVCPWHSLQVQRAFATP